jgi:Flp pilus assembly protein TadB
MDTLVELLIFGIIILIALLYTEIQFKKKDTEDIEIKKELKELWHGSKEDFIEFKKFQYSRSFSLISEAASFMFFSLTISLIGFKEIFVALVGITIYISLILAVLIVFFKTVIILGLDNKKVIKNLRILYNMS